MNVVNILGNITRDPELRYTTTGKAVCNVSVAVNEGYGDKKKTNFVNCVAWEKTAELVHTHFTKGRKILIEGSLQQETWEKDGQKHSTIKIRVNRVHFCDSVLLSVHSNELKPQVDVSRYEPTEELVMIPEEEIF